MNENSFREWLERLRIAWQTKNPQAAARLCAEKFLWYETPFDEPLETKEQLLNEWQSVLSQKDISTSYEILDIYGNTGIVHWSASFTRIPSGEKALLDGIYKVTLDEDGKCTEFHQWYDSK